MLTKEDILSKYNNQPLSEIKNLNFWGKDLTNIDIIEQMPNLEVVSLSANKISSLKPFASCSHLKELYLRKNNISDFDELNYLTRCKELKILWLDQNPICDCENYRKRIIITLPHLIRLDNSPVTQNDNNNSNTPQQRPITPNVPSNTPQTPIEQDIPKRNNLRTSQSGRRPQHQYKPSDQTIVNNILKDYDSSMTIAGAPKVPLSNVESETLNNINKDEQYIHNLKNIEDIKDYFASPYSNDYPNRKKGSNSNSNSNHNGNNNGSNSKGIENFSNYKISNGVVKQHYTHNKDNDIVVNDSLNGITPKNVHIVNAILNLIEGMNLEELVHVRNHISRKMNNEA